MATNDDLRRAIELGIQQDVPNLIMLAKAVAANAEAKGQHGMAMSVRHILERHFSRGVINLADSPELAKNIEKINKFLAPLAGSAHKDFSTLILGGDAEAAVGDIVEGWKKRDALAAHNIDPMTRIMLEGPPGTGKSSFASALAATLNLPLIPVECTAVFAMYLGESMVNLRKVFEVASMSPCVLLLDEFETIATERSRGDDVRESARITSSFLTHLEAMPRKTIVIAATNHGQLLDTAARRRFDMVVHFRVPDSRQVLGLLRILAERHGVAISVSRKALSFADVRQLEPSSDLWQNYAEIESMVRNLVRRMVLEGSDSIFHPGNAAFGEGFLTVRKLRPKEEPDVQVDP